ncbi:hypothetical protein F7725_019975 [Dissostichus mawsoni]|uniref:Macroglobulin domain-containing protein n=1 Tax=Dissostichus mawsoni TaxID=36200 RepID=A0A7J5YL84_DISMA|nr:hypothetical protein F7725_019975 [Dissostichus mawsoni]
MKNPRGKSGKLRRRRGGGGGGGGEEERRRRRGGLHFNPKGSSTFLQTDRSSYLPGQVVKIRAVSVLPDGKPLQRPLNISINDPRGNLLRQWLDVEGVLGVVSTEFQLSETLLWGNGASSPPST